MHSGTPVYMLNVNVKLSIHSIYIMKRSNVSKLALLVPLVLLVAFGLSTATTENVLAWGDWGGGFLQPGPGAYSNGFYAGQQDAIYDHDNNLVYNPVGTCIPCHSELYWHAFHQGYDAQQESVSVSGPKYRSACKREHLW
jgi:hypothetical protein